MLSLAKAPHGGLRTNQSGTKLVAHLREMCPRDKTRTPCVIRDGEQEITEPENIANTFNEYFTNIASQYTSDSQDTRQQQHTQLKNFVSDKLDTPFSIPEIKQHTVYRALMTLRSDKSTGADKISARLLKAVAPAITLINKSIVSGKFQRLETCENYPDTQLRRGLMKTRAIIDRYQSCVLSARYWRDMYMTACIPISCLMSHVS